MSSTKIKTIAEMLWRHKKKTTFAVCLSAYGLKRLDSRIKDDETRRFYAEKAKKFGMESIGPSQKLRRVTVLVNKEAGRGKANQLFSRNALPLLNLAGLDVNVIHVNSPSEMEQIARVIDHREADCLFVIGGDGTICHVLAGICQRSENEPKVPVGLFPGGLRNKSFAVLGFLQSSADPLSNVRLCCESAMALIENRQKTIYPIKCATSPLKYSGIKLETWSDSPYSTTYSSPAEETQRSTYWLISEVTSGWFEHCEQKVPKFWWMGPLRRWFIYGWEAVKAHPEPIRAEFAYEEYCPGCKKCLKLTEQESGGILGWLAWIVGQTAGPKIDANLVQLGKRENPNCGIVHSMGANGTDIRLQADQEQFGSKLSLHFLTTIGRYGTVGEAWDRLAKKPPSSSATKIDDQLDRYIDTTKLENRDAKLETNIEAQRIRMRFTHYKNKIHKLCVSGEPLDFSIDQELFIEASKRGIQFFVPEKNSAKKEGEMQKMR